MAERRMFSKSVTQSARFLMMPASARALYYELGMAADDDGAAEAFVVLRITGASMEDLNTLVSKGYVKILNDELVSYICDWKKNNYIQGDRYRPSVYRDLLVKSGIKVREKETDTGCIQDVYKTDTQVRVGKDSIDKVSLGEGRESAEPQTAVAAEVAAPSPTPKEDVFSLVSEGVDESYINERRFRAEDYAKVHRRSPLSVLREWWEKDRGEYVAKTSSFDTDEFFEAALQRSLKNMSG